MENGYYSGIEQVGGIVNPKKRKALMQLTKDLYRLGMLHCYPSVQREFANVPGVDEIDVIVLEGGNRPLPNPPHDAFLKSLDKAVMNNAEVSGRIRQNISVMSKYTRINVHLTIRQKRLSAGPDNAPVAMLGTYKITQEDRRFLKSLRICCPGDEPRPPLQPTANSHRDKQP